MSCGNSDILALIDYFQNGTDLSSNSWDNYNYYDLWNAIENGTTPPERTVCATFVQADIRSIVFAVLGVFTSPSDYLGDNIDFYYLYLKAIGQEVVSPKFSNFCIGQLYNVFSIGLTAKFRQGQDFNVTMSKVAAIASITFEQGQQLDALLSKSAALQQVVFQQQQTFNAELAAGFTGLLDDYPNAAAAYSVRLLSSTYSGPLVRIRKDTVGQPEKDFYPDSNNELSLNSDDGGGTTLGSWIGLNNAYIVTWYSQTGSNNATQSSASAQPQIISNGSLITENGKAALQTTGSEHMEFGTFASNGMALIAVGNNNGYGTLISGGDNVGNRFDFGPRVTNSYRYFVASGGSDDNLDSGTDTINTYTLFEAYKNSSNSGATYQNGSELINGTMAFDLQAYTSNNIIFGRTFGGSVSDKISGKFQEFIIYPNDQTSNRTGIESNINNFFNIYV